MEKILNRRKNIKIETDFGNIYGYLVGYGTAGIIIKRVNEFHIDWYRFFPHDVVNKIHHWKQEDFFSVLDIQEWIFNKINFDLK